jgi:general nucleoside transport system permease protein
MTATTSATSTPSGAPPDAVTVPAAPAPAEPARWRRVAPTVLIYVVCVGVALGLCALLVSATGGSASAVFSALLDGSLRSPGAWGLTVNTAAPLLCVAAGTIWAGKAGLSNIGQEGQVLLGAAGTAYLATRLEGPGFYVIVVSLAGGVLLGGAWALLAAVMKYTRNVPEVISTLLLYFIAVQITDYALTKRWLLASLSTDSRVNNGQPIKSNARLPGFEVFGNVISAGAVIAILLTAIVSFMLARSTVGFRLRMLGLNPRTARRAGVSAAMVGGTALVVSGATAGLAGAIWLSGGVPGDRFTSNMSSNLGWQGLLVALLARQRALLAIPMAFVFAILRTGSQFLSATGVDRRIADVVQAMLVLALLVAPALQGMTWRRASREAAT